MRTSVVSRPFGLNYWPLAAGRSGCRDPSRVHSAGLARRRAGARRAVDPAERQAVEDRRHPQPPSRRLQRALRLPAAGCRRLCGARLRHPLPEQRHRLPARELHRRRQDGPRRDGAPRCRGGGAAGQLGWRQPDGDGPGAAGHRRRLGGHGRAPRRGRVHAAGHRPQRRRRDRPVQHRARARHVPPRQRLAPLARALRVRRRAGWRRYRAAQVARVARIDAIAKASIAEATDAGGRLRGIDKEADAVAWREQRRRAVFTKYLTIYRTLADPAYLDLSASTPTSGRWAACSRSPTRSMPTTAAVGWRAR